MHANCFRVLRGAMGRVGLWDESMRDACHGDAELLNPTFTSWYGTPIGMTRPAPVRPLLLHGGGNLDLPAGAYFTACHPTRAGRRAAMRALAAHPQWRADPT